MSDQKKIDSNRTGLAIAEEVTLGVLPDGDTEVITINDAITNDAITDISVSWDSALKQLRVDASIAAGFEYIVARVNRNRGGTVKQNVGDQNSAGSDGTYDSIDQPGGSVARWQITGPVTQFPATVFAVIDLEDVVKDGDVLTVQFDNNDSYDGFQNGASGVTIARQEITLTDIATGVAVWFGREPNSYGDFGGEITTTPRNPISAGRQRKKGPTTDLEASGEFNEDHTLTGFNRIMQGFMFADAHANFSTDPLSQVSSSGSVSVASDGTLVLNDASDLAVGHLVHTAGFVNAVNNGGWRITAIAGNIVTAVNLDNETQPVTEANPNARLEVVGYQLGDGVASLSIVGNRLLLSDSSGELVANTNPQVGQWVYLGGDGSNTSFDENMGFARIDQIAGNNLYLVEPSWASPSEVAGSAGNTLQVFFTSFNRNEDDPELQKCRSYQLERSLGRTAAGTQAEYLLGAVADSFSLNFPSADKINADLGFMALRTEYRKAAQGLKPGTRINPTTEDAYNTSNDLYLTRMYIHSDTKLKPDSLFAYVMEGSMTINNNSAANRALGVLGGFAITVGDFEAGGEMTCYFVDVAAVEAVNNNCDVGVYFIGAKNNQGFVYDIPLLTVSGGRIDIEKDEPVKLTVENNGAENKHGYTMSYTYFGYLPNAAMPNSQAC